jgi:hypothetical protein
MENIIERFKAIEKPESVKKVRLGKYSKLMKDGYSPNEIFNTIQDLTVEEAYVYYHLCSNK